MTYPFYSKKMNESRFLPLKGPDFNMDCPDGDCIGWLTFFASRDDPSRRPQFVRCSNFRKNDSSSCSLGIILSKRDGVCLACNKPVLKVRCYVVSTQLFVSEIKQLVWIFFIIKHFYKIGHRHCDEVFWKLVPCFMHRSICRNFYSGAMPTMRLADWRRFSF